MTEHFGVSTKKGLVKATLESPAEPNGNILWLLGRGAARMESLADRKRQAELFNKRMLTFDYGGQGESPGNFAQMTIRDHLSEAQAAYDYLTGEYQGEDLTVMGASYGGFIAAELAAVNNSDSLVLRAPALFPPDYLDTKWAELELKVTELTDGYRQDVEQMKRNPLLAKLAKFTGRILIIQHEQDDVMPPTVLQAYHEALPRADYWLAPDVPHAISAASPEARKHYETHLANWLNG